MVHRDCSDFPQVTHTVGHSRDAESGQDSSGISWACLGLSLKTPYPSHLRVSIPTTVSGICTVVPGPTAKVICTWVFMLIYFLSNTRWGKARAHHTWPSLTEMSHKVNNQDKTGLITSVTPTPCKWFKTRLNIKSIHVLAHYLYPIELSSYIMFKALTGPVAFSDIGHHS